MNKKRNSFACLLATSVIVIPSFVLSGCEQNEGLGDFETEYTLSERMLMTSGDVGGDPLPSNWSKIKAGTAHGVIVDGTTCSEATLTITYTVSWPEISNSAFMDDQNTHFVSRDVLVSSDNPAIKIDEAKAEVSIGGNAIVTILVDFHHIKAIMDNQGIFLRWDTISHPIREQRIHSVEFEY